MQNDHNVIVMQRVSIAKKRSFFYLVVKVQDPYETKKVPHWYFSYLRKTYEL